MVRVIAVLLATLVMLGAMAHGVAAQKPLSPDYKAQLEAALGGKIIAVQKTTRYPASSLTQVLNFTIDRGAGRTDVVPVEVVFIKAEGGYVVKSMYVVNTSTAMMATRRATQLPTPGPTSGGGEREAPAQTLLRQANPSSARTSAFRPNMARRLR